MLKREIVPNWNLNKQYLNSYEALSKGNQQPLWEEACITKHVSQTSLNYVLLDDHDEDHKSQHNTVSEWIISFRNFIREFLINN